MLPYTPPGPFLRITTPTTTRKKDGALVQQRDADIPVAKLAEDNWVTAMAWRHQASTTTTANSAIGNPNNTVAYGSRDEISAVEEAPSVSRWRSARATARQARRITSTSTSNSSSGGGSGGRGDTVAASTAACRNTSSLPFNLGETNRSGGAAGAGGGGGSSGWDRASAIVIVGDGSEGSEEEASR